MVHGGAAGADQHAQKAARELHLNTHSYPAQWEKYGNRAGIIRNGEMLTLNPDISLVLAFTDDFENSKGTRHMVTLARSKRIPVRLYRHNQDAEIEMVELGFAEGMLI